MVPRMGALALLLLVALVSPAPAQARTPETTYQHDVLVKTNAARANHDRPKLRGEPCVQKFAARHAKRMANQERMFHQELEPLLEACDLSLVGENVGYGFSSGASVVQAWMGSPGHRANILEGRFRLLGVGARRSEDGTWYAAQVFGRKA